MIYQDCSLPVFAVHSSSPQTPEKKLDLEDITIDEDPTVLDDFFNTTDQPSSGDDHATGLGFYN